MSNMCSSIFSITANACTISHYPSVFIKVSAHAWKRKNIQCFKFYKKWTDAEFIAEWSSSLLRPYDVSLTHRVIKHYLIDVCGVTAKYSAKNRNSKKCWARAKIRSTTWHKSWIFFFFKKMSNSAGLFFQTYDILTNKVRVQVVHYHKSHQDFLS